MAAREGLARGVLTDRETEKFLYFRVVRMAARSGMALMGILLFMGVVTAYDKYEGEGIFNKTVGENNVIVSAMAFIPPFNMDSSLKYSVLADIFLGSYLTFRWTISLRLVMLYNVWKIRKKG